MGGWEKGGEGGRIGWWDICRSSRVGEKQHIPFLQILNPTNFPLGIPHHFAEQVRETRSTEFRVSASVQVPVVDCFAV